MILQRYITKELSSAFVLICSVLVGVVTLTVPFFQFHRKYSHIGLDFLVSIVPYFIPLAIIYIIPIAILVASVFVFGRLSENNEIIAIKASGLHLGRVISPVFLLGIFLGIIMVIMNISFIPYCYAQTRNLTILVLKSRFLSPNVSVRNIKLPGYRISYDDFKGGVFTNISIAKFLDEKNSYDLVKAATGTVDFDEQNANLSFNLQQVIKESETDWAAKEPKIGTSDSLKIVVDLTPIFAPRKKNLPAMSNSQLNQMIKNKETDRFRLWQIQTEKHKRFSLGLAPLIFLLIGAPVGILTRKGSKVAGVGLSFLIVAVGYYPLVMFGNFIGAHNYAPPYLSVWLANSVSLIIAGILLYVVFRR